jgi:hypothetical protein
MFSRLQPDVWNYPSFLAPSAHKKSQPTAPKFVCDFCAQISQFHTSCKPL